MEYLWLLFNFRKSSYFLPTSPTQSISVLFETVEILIFILEHNDYFKIHEFSMDFRMRYNGCNCRSKLPLNSGKLVVDGIYIILFVCLFFKDLQIFVFCLAIYLRSLPHKLPRYVKVPKGKEKPLPKKFDWRDKKVIAEVRNQQTVSPGVFHSWFSAGSCGAQGRFCRDQLCLKTHWSTGKSCSILCKAVLGLNE